MSSTHELFGGETSYTKHNVLPVKNNSLKRIGSNAPIMVKLISLHNSYPWL
jgi:hypothetical protein